MTDFNKANNNISFIQKLKDNFTKLPIIVVCVILLLGAGYRLTAFGAHTSLHFDEALYGKWSASIGYNYRVMFDITGLDKPPLFYYMLGGSFFLFGLTDQALKLPGFIAGLLLILVTMLIAFQLGGRNAALWTAFFYALSPLEILYAPTGFSDTTCALFSLLVLMALLYRSAFWSGVFFGLGCAVKQSVLFFVPLYAVIYVLKFHGVLSLSLKRALKGFLAVVVPLLLWAVVCADKGLDIFTAIYQEQYFKVAYSWSYFLHWLEMERFIAGNWIKFGFSVTVIACALILFVWRAFKQRKLYLEIPVLFSFFCGYTLLISWVRYPQHYRYLLVVSGVYLILFGTAMAVISEDIVRILKRKVKGSMGICMLLFLGVTSYWLLSTPADIAQFPDGAHHNRHETIKPCIDYIKNQPYPSAVFYTDNMWPWANWYVFAQKERGEIACRLADFKTVQGIRNIISYIKTHQDEMAGRTLYFIIDSLKYNATFHLFEQELGTVVHYDECFVSESPHGTAPSYRVYKVILAKK